jgi:putative SOS response-associated peptidase YedK
MCGRYAFYQVRHRVLVSARLTPQRPSVVRQQLAASNMAADEAPSDDAVRTSYNFAPGYNGLVYRADVPDYGIPDEELPEDSETHYKLQAMKWGLVPSWTKRSPDYQSLMRTINCRDDSLAEAKSMWVSMKKRKRCLVVCQGFYEWLKKNNGRERIPHFIKRKDNQLMCLAGLWDAVKYPDSEETLYTYTIITTDSNKQLKFLHDRMPVIFNPGDDAIHTWLDPHRNTWTKELQSLLKPWNGELEIYAVSKDVGKVGNNSPSFIVPIDSEQNKNNIANFFSKTSAKPEAVKKEPAEDVQQEAEDVRRESKDVKQESSHEDIPLSPQKRPLDEGDEADSPAKKIPRPPEPEPEKKDPPASPAKTTRKSRSATSNGTVTKSPAKKDAAAGSQRITSFFGKRQ